MNELSEYQQAVLSELGINQWRISEGKSTLFDNASIVDSETDVEHAVAEDSRVESNSIDPITQIDVSQGVLLLMSEQESQTHFVQDVLSVLELDDTDVVIAPNEPLERYTEYVFAWHVGESMNWQENVLQTPDIEQLIRSAEDKKQLWEILL